MQSFNAEDAGDTEDAEECLSKIKSFDEKKYRT
jgi:hypothetical protein